jgi:hypothetical protein
MLRADVMSIDESYVIKDTRHAADSVGHLEELLNMNEKDGNALWHLSRVHSTLGNGKECRILLDRLLKIDSNHRNALALRSLLEAYKPGARQTFGVLSIEDETNAVIGPPELLHSQQFAYTMFPVLSLPLGSTVEDAMYAMSKGGTSRFTGDYFVKCVIVHMSFSKTDTKMVTHALSTKLWFFEKFQPWSFIIRFMERGPHRGINPANNRYDLIESGDLILLTPPISPLDDLRLSTYYPVIKSQVAQELANWSYTLNPMNPER